MKASKLTARGLAYVLRAVGRKIAKAHREAQTPHGKQSVKKLMAHGTATNSIEVDAPKVFDRVARKWNVDYAFYKTGPDKWHEQKIEGISRNFPPLIRSDAGGWVNTSGSPKRI